MKVQPIKERSFGSVLLTALKRLLLKIISFKNVVAIVSIVLGMVVASKTNVSTTFRDWDAFMFKVLVLFFASNQVQKWIFAKYKVEDTRPDALYDETEECDYTEECDEDEGEDGWLKP